MGGGVASRRSDEGGLPEIRGGAAGGVREGIVWVGVLDSQECE